MTKAPGSPGALAVLTLLDEICPLDGNSQRKLCGSLQNGLAFLGLVVYNIHIMV
jgi:hypothetical protein